MSLSILKYNSSSAGDRGISLDLGNGTSLVISSGQASISESSQPSQTIREEYSVLSKLPFQAQTGDEVNS